MLRDYAIVRYIVSSLSKHSIDNSRGADQSQLVCPDAGYTAIASTPAGSEIFDRLGYPRKKIRIVVNDGAANRYRSAAVEKFLGSGK